MTLLEMTIVILVMMTLIGITFIGAKSWKRGSDRALCIMNLQLIQKGVRSVSNLYGYSPGTTVSGLQDQVIGEGNFVSTMPVCRGGGSYVGGGDTIPVIGQLYMTCSLSTSSDHTPATISDW